MRDLQTHQQSDTVALGVAGSRRPKKVASHRLAPRVPQQVGEHWI